MDLSNAKKDRAKRIVSMLYTPPGILDSDDLLLSPDLLDEVNRTISQAHELYFDSITRKVLLRWKPEYETGSERMLDRTTQTDRHVLFILYLLYRHPFIPDEQRTGKPAEQKEVSRDTVLRIAEKAGMNKVAVERSLTTLTRLGYLEGSEWPRRVGNRLRALPSNMFSKIEEAAFRWHILVSAGLEEEGTSQPQEKVLNPEDLPQNRGDSNVAD